MRTRTSRACGGIGSGACPGTDGAITSRTVNGQSWATFVGADGTVYAAANPEANDGMNMLITRPSGATTTTTILGAANGTMVAPDGKTYVTSWAAGSYTVTTIGIANDAGQPPHVDPVNPYTTDPAQAGDPAGTVRGHINSPQGSGWTFTGPVTTAHGTLTVSPDGSYVYTPTDEARHLAATEGSGPLTDTFAISVANANGSTDVHVTVPVGPPLNAAPTAPVTPPAALTDHANGQVSSGLGMLLPVETDTIDQTANSSAMPQAGGSTAIQKLRDHAAMSRPGALAEAGAAVLEVFWAVALMGKALGAMEFVADLSAGGAASSGV